MARFSMADDIVKTAASCIDNKSMDALLYACDDYNMSMCYGCNGCDERDEEEVGNCGEQKSLATLLELPGDVAFSYRTWLDVNDCSFDPEGQVSTLEEIKELLGITTDKHDQALLEMIDNSSGGRLNVYFYCGLGTFLPVNGGDFDDITHITFFGDVIIGSVDGANGSGHCVTIQHEFTLPFDHDYLYVDSLKGYGYSWTKDIAGESENWCESTQFRLTIKEAPMAAA